VLEVKKSKGKVIRPIKSITKSVSYLPNGKVYEVQTWYTDGIRRLLSPIGAVTSKVKGQGLDVTWCI